MIYRDTYELDFDEAGQPVLFTLNYKGSVGNKKPLKPNINSRAGYSYWGVGRKGERRETVKCHRLVAQFCIPNDDPINKPWVDHINGDRRDNRVCNLRWVTKSVNQHNRKNAIGYTLHNGKYQVSICKDGYKQYIGRYDTEEEARAAYLNASEQLFGVGAKVVNSS